MSLKTTTKLASLKASYSDRTPVPLTRDEMVMVLRRRQADQMTLAGLDPEFELEFAEGVMELHRALAPKADEEKSEKKKKTSSNRKKSSGTSRRKKAGADEIIVENRAKD